jgi:hypothetical protein
MNSIQSKTESSAKLLVELKSSQPEPDRPPMALHVELCQRSKVWSSELARHAKALQTDSEVRARAEARLGQDLSIFENNERDFWQAVSHSVFSADACVILPGQMASKHVASFVQRAHETLGAALKELGTEEFPEIVFVLSDTQDDFVAEVRRVLQGIPKVKVELLPHLDGETILTAVGRSLAGKRKEHPEYVVAKTGELKDKGANNFVADLVDRRKSSVAQTANPEQSGRRASKLSVANQTISNPIPVFTEEIPFEVPSAAPTEEALSKSSTSSTEGFPPSSISSSKTSISTNEDSKGSYPMASLTDTLNTAMTLDGAIAVALVDYNSGMLLAKAGGGTLNLEYAAAGNSEVIKAKMRTMKGLGLNENIEDILITLGSQYHLIRMMPSKPGLFLYFALDKSKANLAMARYKLAETEKFVVI